MKILFLAHRIPYPPDKGDKIRSFNEIRYLSRFHDVYLATILDQESDKKLLDELRVYCKEVYAVHYNKSARLLKSLFSRKPFSVSNFYDGDLQKYVDGVVRKENLHAILCFCSSMAQYIFRCSTLENGGRQRAKLVMDYVDMDSDKWRQYATYAKFPLNLVYGLEHRRLFRYEVKINRTFDHSIFVSKREEDVFGRMCPGCRNVRVIPNGVDFEYFVPKWQPQAGTEQAETPMARWSGGPVLVFTGVMDYFANEDGVQWFCKEMFPRIRREVPGVELYIVGNRP